MGGALLFTGMGLAQAAPLQIQDGLVNLALGDITGAGKRIRSRQWRRGLRGSSCPDVNVEDVNVLAEQLDADGGSEPSTPTAPYSTQPVSLEQNGPGQGNAANAPGQNRG